MTEGWVLQWAEKGASLLVDAGALPSGFNVGGLTLLEALPFAVWGYLVYNWQAGAFDALVQEKRYGVYRPEGQYGSAEKFKPPLMCFRPDVVQEIAGFSVHVPVYQTERFSHKGGKLDHWRAFPDSLIYDASGRLRSVGSEQPAGNYWIIDPVLAIAPVEPGTERGGWAFLRSLDVVEDLTNTPKIPADWPGNIRNRMISTGEAVYEGLTVTPEGGQAPVVGGPEDGPDRSGSREGVSPGAAALALLGWLVSRG